MSALIPSNPRPRVLSTNPHVASLLVCFVSSGPRICQLPVCTRFIRQDEIVTIQTQRMLRNARQPARMSVNRADSRLIGTAVVSCRRVKQPAATRKVTASIATAAPLPAVTTSTPETLGPRILVAFRAEPSSEFACRSWSLATNCGTTPRSAGVENAAKTPFRNSKTATAPRL
jgi:hypothetical protein